MVFQLIDWMATRDMQMLALSNSSLLFFWVIIVQNQLAVTGIQDI